MNPFRPIVRVYSEAYSGLPRDVWMLCLAALVNRAGTMVLPFFALFLTRDRGLSVLEAGRLVSLYGVGSFVGSLGGGLLSDRIGSIRTQQASLLLAGVGYMAILAADGPAALAVVVFLASVAAEAFRPAVMTSIAHRAPPGLQGRSFALLRLAVNLGMGVGPAVGGWLATRSYKLLFVADAATGWAAAVLLFVLLPSARRGRGDPAPSEFPPGRSPWRDGPFLMLTGIVALLACCFFQVFSTLPIYLQREFGMRETGIGLVIGFNALLIVVFEMVLIQATAGRDRLRTFGVGCMLVCLGLGLLPLGSGLGWAALTTAVWTFGEMLALPLATAAVADRASAAARGRYMGMHTMAFSLAFVVAPAAGTSIMERFGAEVLWYAVGAMGPLLAAAAFLLSGPFRASAAPGDSGRGART